MTRGRRPPGCRRTSSNPWSRLRGKPVCSKGSSARGQLGQKLTDPTELSPEWNPQLPSVRGHNLGPVARRGRCGRSSRQILSDFDRDKSRWRRGINHATCAASRWVGAIDRIGSDPTVHGQWVDANLLGELPLVEPGVPELTNELIDLGLVAAPTRTLDVMHPSPSPDLHRIGNHGVHRTLTPLHRLDMVVAGHRAPGSVALLRPPQRDNLLNLQHEPRGACINSRLDYTPSLTKPQQLSKRLLWCHRPVSSRGSRAPQFPLEIATN